jgi:hypothetical protein
MEASILDLPMLNLLPLSCCKDTTNPSLAKTFVEIDHLKRLFLAKSFQLFEMGLIF